VIENHGDIRVQGLLGSYSLLRREQVFASVVNGAETNPALLHFQCLGEREDLETTAIGEQWALPTHKRMQASLPLYQFGPGAQKEMIGIGQQHLKSNILEFPRRHGLHGTPGSHGEKCRRLDSAAAGIDIARPRHSCCIPVGYLEKSTVRHLLSISPSDASIVLTARFFAHDKRCT
jgi:hypothetical protein